jgi:hypothetical protein
LVKAEKLNKQVETSGKRTWKKLKIDNFGPVSEKTLSIFGGLFCYLSGTILGCVLLFRKRPRSIS